MAVTIDKGKLAFIQVNGSKIEGTVLAFDSPAGVTRLMKELKEKMAPDAWANLMAMKPDIGTINAIQ